MPPRRARHLCFTMALLVALVGALVPVHAQQEGDQDTAAQVPWSRMVGISVGDTWSYVLSGAETGEIHNRVAREVQHTDTYWKNTYPAYEIRAEGTIESDELTVTETTYEVFGTKWVRKSDYATIEVQGQSRVENFDNSESSESFNPPLVDTVHPFTTGYDWAAESIWYSNPESRSDNGAARLQDIVQRARVEGQESITVPAGTFTAWKVNYTSFRADTSYAIRWHVDEVCDFVREDAFDNERRLKYRLELTEYSCTASEVAQPVYDTDHVTLLSRGIAGGATGEEVPRPGKDDHAAVATTPGATWSAMLVLAGVGLFACASTRLRC